MTIRPTTGAVTRYELRMVVPPRTGPDAYVVATGPDGYDQLVGVRRPVLDGTRVLFPPCRRRTAASVTQRRTTPLFDRPRLTDRQAR